MGMGKRIGWPSHNNPDCVVCTAHHVRNPLRTLDGLRGLPHVSYPRGMGHLPRAAKISSTWRRQHCASHNNRSTHHDRGVLLVRHDSEPHRSSARVRYGGRRVTRRNHCPHGARSRHHGTIRQSRLVVPEVA